MKIWQILTIVILLAVAATMLTASAFAYMNGQGVFNPYFGYSGMMGGNGSMMGGYGYNSYPPVASQIQSNTTAQPIRPNYPYQHGGPGCGNHAPYGYTAPGTAITSPINNTTANTIAQNFLTGLNNPDLAIAQVEEYSQNFYVQIREKSTGFGAFELIIDKNTGTLYPEMGPNMMWNTKYGSITTDGMMGGMMNGYAPYAGVPTATMPITVTQAKTDAQQFLNVNYPGTTVGDAATFYGYYAIEALNGSTTYGMLSVNGYTGQVWYHTWHGTFIQEA
jgi:hypothetical protein